MSIEKLIGDLITAVTNLTTVIQSGGLGEGAATGDAPARGRGRPKKDEAAGDVLPGDAPGTKYYINAKLGGGHKQAPGEPKPNIDGLEPATSAEFAAFIEKVKAGATTQTTTTNTSGAARDFKNVTVKFMDVCNAKDIPTAGPDNARKILVQFGGAGTKKVSELEKLNKDAEIIAALDALLNPAAADDDMFS